MRERCATFEQGAVQSTGFHVTRKLADFLKGSTRGVVTHLEKRSPRVAHMELNFKVDEEHKVGLLHCSPLRLLSMITYHIWTGMAVALLLAAFFWGFRDDC